jgi:quinol-cytochrome oxidoreductase complex cytochrome b subunit
MVSPQQAYWRAVHLALAYTFIAGLVIHVATVTFFAGYVADGGPITWWHLTAW